MSNITIRINGLQVTLVVDGRETVRTFVSVAEARSCYERYLAKIKAATPAN